MSEYIAVVITIYGLMFFLLDLSFRLSNTYDPLKMLLIGISLFLGSIGLHIGRNVATDSGLGTAIQDALDTAYYVWIIVTIVFITYVIIYLIIRAYNGLKISKKLKLYEDDNK